MSDQRESWGRLQRIVVDPSAIQANWVKLNTTQQHYLYRVLRLQPGDRFIVMDGRGQTWLAQRSGAEDQAELLEAVSLRTELPIAVHLWIAPPKGNGLEDVIRQATEVGVAEIHPILSDRTLFQPNSHKLDRWRRIALEAAEQSERQHVVQISEPIRLRDAAFFSQNTTTRYFAVTRQTAPHFFTCLQAQYTGSRISSPSELWVATGPEGGWTDAEVETAIATGAVCVSLGSRILRAVTAPIVAAALVAAIWEAEPITKLDYP